MKIPHLVWIATIFTLICSATVHASRINTNNSTIVSTPDGFKVVATEAQPSRMFEFSPFTGHDKRTVRGFSDPLGTGADPSLKLFSGAVENMDLLGDFHPANPYDPTELAPTKESLETAKIINDILYSVRIPGKNALLATQINLKRTTTSEYHPAPRTAETSPLILAGFGNVNEVTKPLQLHWTHCPGYAFKRYIFKSSIKGGQIAPKPGRPRPKRDCFII